MPDETIVLRYMTRFRCIAERCEDTCCGGLKVSVSEEHLGRMRQAVAGRPEEAEQLERGLELHPEGPPDARAYTRKRLDGLCAFLDAERLCSVQRRYGEAAIPDVCATFPRVLKSRGGRLEVSGSMACPEVARLCLLAEDAVQPVEAPVDMVSRPSTVSPPVAPAHAGQACAEALRQAALRLLDRRELSLSSWLIVLGRMALVLDTLATEAAEEALRLDLTEVLRRFETPEALEAVHRDVSALELPGGPSLGVYGSMLRARLEGGGTSRLTALLRGVLESLGLDGDAPEQLEPAWRTYVSRQQQLASAHGARVRQYFHHYCLNALWRTPFLETPGTLLADVFRLALRLGLLRVVLVGHPRVAALFASGTLGTAEAQAVLDEAAVEGFQLSAKYLAHAPLFVELAQALAGAGGVETLNRTRVWANLLQAGCQPQVPPGTASAT
jgi:lysine-N-methylase